MESFDGVGGGSIPGVNVHHWDTSDIQMTEVIISDPDGAELLGKPCGVYLTLSSDGLRDRDPDVRMAMAALLGEELGRMLPPDSDSPVLVVGLGNRFITPDSLGPLVIDKTLVTRHILENGFGSRKLRSVCAVAPGVLGVTGVETMEMIQSLTEKLHPRAVLCIDSLAARASDRIGSTIQLADSGIQPGAGVGNHRRPLTKETLGTDVIAVGMPTVVHAATLARDAFACLADRQGTHYDEKSLSDMEHDLFSERIGEMIVTPREIDSIVQDAAGIIASGINRALQPELSEAEISAMMD